MEKGQVDDNVSTSDQISHEQTSSISENKPSVQNLRIADVSSVSSERVHSTGHSSVRSDVGSGTAKTLTEKRKYPSSGRVKDVSAGDSSTTVSFPHKQLKADSSSSKESAAVAQPSSVGSVALNPGQPLSNYGCSLPTQSDESKNVCLEPESSVTVKSDRVAASVQSSLFEFDLNECIEDTGADCHPMSSQETNTSGDALHLSEPIPVVAKVGVPIGSPKKPLQFGGEHGWRRLGISSAFCPTMSKNSDTEKGSGGYLNDCHSKSPLCREFDLNVAATADLELPFDKSPMDISPQKPGRSHFSSLRGTENCLKPGTSSIDLNDNPMVDYGYNNIHRQNEARQVSRNCNTIDTATGSIGSASQLVADARTSPYWVDLSSVQGYGQMQTQTLLLGAPAGEQVQMMVPIELSNTPPGLYFGKINGLTPTFYPPNVLHSFHNQLGTAAIPQISGPILTAYPGNVHLLESSQGLNPHAYANMRQTVLPNGSIALVANGNRGVNSAELLMPARNSFLEERIKADQVTFPTSSMKRREPDTGWGSSQINCRQMASWN